VVARLLTSLAVAAVAAAPAAAAGPAPPRLACQASRTCPSSTHSYVWRGLVCADRAHRSGADTTVIVWKGRAWWCRPKAAPPAPAPAPPPVDPLASFRPRVAGFVQQYLGPALDQVRADATTYAALAGSTGLTALQACSATLTATVGTPPADPTAQAAFSQLQTMCDDFQAAANEIRDGVAALDSDKVDAGLDRFKAGIDLQTVINRSLGL
jgi:hypothetical protein